MVAIESGNTFGRLTVMRLEKTVKGRRHWRCKCICGNHKLVPTRNLTSGKTTSCGCWRRELKAVEMTAFHLGRKAASLG